MAGLDGGGMTARVLVVDDNAAFRRSAVHLLTLRGFIVLPAATDRQQALDLVALAGCPDAALVDVHLPDDDGREVGAALRTACPSIRVVLTSSDADLLGVDVARYGAVAFVAKDDLALADLDTLFAGDDAPARDVEGDPA